MLPCKQHVEDQKHNFRATVGCETEIKNKARCVSWVSKAHQADPTICDSSAVYYTDKLSQEPCSYSGEAIAAVWALPIQLLTDGEEAKPFPIRAPQMRCQSPSPTWWAIGPCFKCGESGHLKKDCMRSPSPTGAQKNIMKKTQDHG